MNTAEEKIAMLAAMNAIISTTGDAFTRYLDGSLDTKGVALKVLAGVADSFLNFVAPEILKSELDAAAVRRANALANAAEKMAGLAP